MKRLYSIVLCLALVISLCATAHAATTVSRDEAADQPYLYVIPDFYSPILYAYLADSTGAPLDPLPGVMMARRGGVYEVELPPDITTVSIRTQSESYQSGDISILPNVDVWITLSSSGTLEVSYQQPDDLPTSPGPALPEYRVVGNADILGNWYPDNDQGIMIRTGENDYALKLTDVPPGEYEFIITTNGTYDGSIWNDGDYFRFFTDRETTDVLITLTLSDSGASVGIRSPGNANTNAGDPVVVKPTEPTVIPPEPVVIPTEPVIIPTEPVTVPTEPVIIPTEPVTIPTEPVTVPTEPVIIPTEPVTIPTEPVTVPTEPATNPTESTTESTETTVPVSGAESQEPPAEPDSAQIKVSPLVNLPIYSLNLFFIGIICVVLYLLLLLRRRKKEQAAMVPGGTVVTSGALSVKATEQLVKDNPIQPSETLDDAVLNAIQAIDQEKE